jgi:hypothetical protein
MSSSPQIAAGLDLNDLKVNLARIFQTMEDAKRNIA